ncbi:MAG: hypothetical protein P1U36_03420 [Legionellaceae bacterium]|nr:hypothetical protein [Legionellaceae bacterium]
MKTHKNQEQLTKMLKENKISQEDHDLLLGAMDKDKQSCFSKQNLSLLVNPFQKIAGVQALMFGLIIMLVVSFLSAIGAGSLSISSAGIVHNKTTGLSLTQLTYQYFALWLIFSLGFALTAKLFRKKIRLIDFLGTFAFAYYPSIFLGAITAITQIINPSFLTSIKEMATKTLPLFSPGILAYLVLVMFFQVWQIATQLYAFKESSGLTGKKLGWGFAITYLLISILGTQLIARLIA